MSGNPTNINNKKSYLEPVIDWIGEILAMLTILLVLAVYIDGGIAEFLPDTARNFMLAIREIAIIGVVCLKALEFALKRRLKIVLLLSLVIIAAVVVFMCFPGAIPGWV